jgi:23S rRNA (uracil1939-C5)-methyltransferase
MLSRMLKANARNNIDNCEFYVGDMKVVLMILLLRNTDNLMLSLLTHRETECTKMWLNKSWKLPRKIVYVSNSATARDLALMDEKYKVTRVRPVDMFPQTHQRRMWYFGKKIRLI